jgi:hypothetical protein
MFKMEDKMSRIDVDQVLANMPTLEATSRFPIWWPNSGGIATLTLQFGFPTKALGVSVPELHERAESDGELEWVRLINGDTLQLDTYILHQDLNRTLTRNSGASIVEFPTPITFPDTQIYTLVMKFSDATALDKARYEFDVISDRKERISCVVKQTKVPADDSGLPLRLYLHWKNSLVEFLIARSVEVWTRVCGLIWFAGLKRMESRLPPSLLREATKFL